MNKNYSAFIYVVFANIIWASAGILVRFINISGTQVQFLSGVFGIISFLIYVVVIKKFALIKEIKLTFLNFLYFLTTAHLGLAIFNAFRDPNFPVAATNLILNSSPFLIVILAPIFLKERSTLREIIFSMVGLLGLVFFIVSGQDEVEHISFSFGLWLALAALVLNTLSTLLNRKISSEGNELIAPFLTLFANMTIPPIYLFFFNGWNFSTMSVTGLILTIILGVSSSCFGFVLIAKGFKYLKAQTISIISLIQPILTAILGYIVLSEDFNLGMIIGAVIVIVSTFGIIAVKEQKKN